MMSVLNLKCRDTCRICRSKDLTLYLDLGDQPPSNSFIPVSAIKDEATFPLKVFLCNNCGLSQLIHIVSASDIFDDYAYLSSTSKALCNHYQEMVDAALDRFSPDEQSLIVDIGCNDGITLSRYPKDKFKLLGIEPSSAGALARKAGFEVAERFFNKETARDIQGTHGKAAIVTATNVFAHVDDIQSFAAGIACLLRDDGVAIFEFPYLHNMLEDLYFDTIYHEHLCYLALTPLTRLFDDVGLRAFNVERTEVGASGPALRLSVCLNNALHNTDVSISDMLADEASWGVKDIAVYLNFSERVANVKSEILQILTDLKSDGHKIGAYGAPAKGNTLLNYLGVGPDDIIAAADNNDLKIGKVTPGSHIPICGDDAFIAQEITHALLLTWNYADFFLKNSDFIKTGNKFIIPFPAPHIAPAPPSKHNSNVEIDIVIPVYNECGNIVSVLDSLFEHVKTPYRVLICYDIDEDDTLAVLDNYPPERAEIMLVKNYGQGPNQAVISGFRASTAPAVLVHMADDDYNAPLIDQMYQQFKMGHDVITGSRYIKGGCYQGAPLLKQILTRTASFTLYHLRGMPIHDATNGFRLFSRRLIDTVEITSSEGFTFTFELLVKADRLGWKISEVPATWIERTVGTSRFKVKEWILPYLRWYLYGLETRWLGKRANTVVLNDPAQAPTHPMLPLEDRPR